MDLSHRVDSVKYLIRDRNAKFPDLFNAILSDAGIEVVGPAGGDTNPLCMPGVPAVSRMADCATSDPGSVDSERRGGSGERMDVDAAAHRFPRSSPYWPVVTHGVLRRVLPGLILSSLGDGMAVLAVSWLALQLAPPAGRGGWVAVAVAAYTLPAAAGSVLFARPLRGHGGAQVAGWDAWLRAGGLGAVAVAAAAGVLTIGLYVGLLAVSSLLHSWGTAGRYTLVAQSLPAEHRLAANSVLSAIANLATVVGPPIAGVLIGAAGSVWVIAVDAVTFVVLALTYRLAGAGTRAAMRDEGRPRRAAGFTVIRRDPTLLGLLALTFVFFLLFGPVYVALPLHVVDDLHASARVLGGYYTAFGVGALLGNLAGGYLRRRPLWPTTITIVVGFGVAMLPLGLGAPMLVSLPSFALAAIIWAPYMSTSMALFQASVPVEHLPQVLAANGSVLVVAVPLGTLLGGPLTTAVGPGRTLLCCAAATLALGLIAATMRLHHRRARSSRSTPAPPAAPTPTAQPDAHTAAPAEPPPSRYTPQA